MNQQNNSNLEPSQRFANLSYRDLSYKDLRGYDFTGANLRGTKLIESDLSGAILKLADLTNADLRLANLSNANLEGTNFSLADLSAANLKGAITVETNFVGANVKLIKEYPEQSSRTSFVVYCSLFIFCMIIGLTFLIFDALRHGKDLETQSEKTNIEVYKTSEYSSD